MAITWRSWVEKMKVVPNSRLMRLISSRMLFPVLLSRLAVGSSASTMRGLMTKARAIATRWRWPPLN